MIILLQKIAFVVLLYFLFLTRENILFCRIDAFSKKKEQAKLIVANSSPPTPQLLKSFEYSKNEGAYELLKNLHFLKT